MKSYASACPLWSRTVEVQDCPARSLWQGLFKAGDLSAVKLLQGRCGAADRGQRGEAGGALRKT
jgi:hypothetical protein